MRVSFPVHTAAPFFDLDKPVWFSGGPDHLISNLDWRKPSVTWGINPLLMNLQVYEGLVYMDFNKELMETRKYGELLAQLVTESEVFGEQVDRV